MEQKLGRQDLNSLFRMASQSDVHVLISGETGTGKSLLARRIHEQSSRKAYPFVEINLATLHEGTLESELFGHEKGAFTGANEKRMGRLELAQNGTVFLDEVGELSLRLQARLLDFLQTKKIVSVGGNREIRLNVRVIAATHRDLRKLVFSGNFREDLLYRLRVLEISLPPLRERIEELSELIHSCLARACAKAKRSILKISEGAAEWFEVYSWPGNIRELENVLDYAVLASSDAEIGLEDLPFWLFQGKEKKGEADLLSPASPYYGTFQVFLTENYQETLDSIEKEYLSRAFERHRGRVTRVAERIGLNKSTLSRRLKKFDLMKKNVNSSRI